MALVDVGSKLISFKFVWSEKVNFWDGLSHGYEHSKIIKKAGSKS